MTFELSPFTDLSGVTRLTTGNHYSHFYDGPDDLADAVVPFIATGVQNNEQCLWVTAEPLGTEQARAALEKVVPDLDRRMTQGQVEIIDHGDWYTAAGGFSAQAVIAGWIERERIALTSGYAGLRITGNTFWLDTPQDFENFAAYERDLHKALHGRRITCLCSYCINKGSGKDILEVIRNHDFAMVRTQGQWEILESASIKTAKNELSERLSNKERLLTEIHHRVKNNLQIVASLLMLKSPEFGPTAGAALDDILNRIGAMGLVHQMLYEQESGGLVSLPFYLDRLSKQLATAYDCQGRISICVEVEPSSVPMLDLDTAIPVGIAITEAITNAIKHAFPEGRAGRIVVGVSSTETNAQVTIRDDGKGCDFSRMGGKVGAGLTLIRGLAAQVGGRVEFASGDGATLTLSFPIA